MKYSDYIYSAMKPYHICTILILFLFNSCRSGNGKLLNELAKRYPDLYKNGSIEQYSIVRSVTNKNSHGQIELQLLESGDQQIVIISNKEGQIYAVPFPSDDYRDYWRFYGDSLSKVKNLDSKTFSAELKMAFKILSIKDSWEARRTLNDILVALVGSRHILDNDTTRIKTAAAGDANKDSCSNIFKHNYQAILKGMNQMSSKGNYSCWNYNAYWDDKHSRTYQFEAGSGSDTKNFYFNVKVYREPCIIKPIIL